MLVLSRRSSAAITAPVLPPNIPETTKSVLPDGALGGLTVLAASDRGQRTLVDVSYDMGLFTRYLIEGLGGDANLAPIGNGDGKLVAGNYRLHRRYGRAGRPQTYRAIAKSGL